MVQTAISDVVVAGGVVMADDACMQTHGGFGFAEEHDVERKLRETRLYLVAPISTNLILSYPAEHVLGLPRGYRGGLRRLSTGSGPSGQARGAALYHSVISCRPPPSAR